MDQEFDEYSKRYNLTLDKQLLEEKIKDTKKEILEIQTNILIPSLRMTNSKKQDEVMKPAMIKITDLTNKVKTMEKDLERFKDELTKIENSQMGGAIQKKSLKRTDEKKLVKGYNRVIYLGKQNKKYVQIKGAFVPLSSIK